MGGGPITKELVKKIIRKLGAVDETQPSDAHDIWAVYYEGELVASFGVRRSSKRDIPHPHIPASLGVNEHFARALGRCTKSNDEWLRKRGLLPEEGEAN